MTLVFADLRVRWPVARLGPVSTSDALSRRAMFGVVPIVPYINLLLFSAKFLSRRLCEDSYLKILLNTTQWTSIHLSMHLTALPDSEKRLKADFG